VSFAAEYFTYDAPKRPARPGPPVARRSPSRRGSDDASCPRRIFRLLAQKARFPHAKVTPLAFASPATDWRHFTSHGTHKTIRLVGAAGSALISRIVFDFRGFLATRRIRTDDLLRCFEWRAVGDETPPPHLNWRAFSSWVWSKMVLSATRASSRSGPAYASSRKLLRFSRDPSRFRVASARSKAPGSPASRSSRLSPR